MKWYTFEWDENNIDHIARHDYTPDEVEEVFIENCEVRRIGERYIARGATIDGRMTVVVFERKKTAIRVVTARDMNAREKQAFRRK